MSGLKAFGQDSNLAWGSVASYKVLHVLAHQESGPRHSSERESARPL